MTVPPKLFRDLGFSDWNDPAQRATYDNAIQRAMSTVHLTGFDFKNPWREQEQRSAEAVQVFQKSLSEYCPSTAFLIYSLGIPLVKSSAKNISGSDAEIKSNTKTANGKVATQLCEIEGA